MELAVLPARIDRRREVAQQRGIELATRELARELRGVHANQHGAVPQLDEFTREGPGVPEPQRKQSLHAVAAQHALAVRADVCEKQVAEDHCVEPRDPAR